MPPILKPLILATTFALVAMAPLAQAQSASEPPANRGWFFFDDPKPPVPAASEPAATPPSPPPASQAPATPQKKCIKKESWTPECGFVDPGEDFSFQAKQRDALFERMVVAKNNPAAVEAVQRYMNWTLERASEVANLWVYNAVQKPDLDPNIKAPVSTFGLKLMADIGAADQKKLFANLRAEGAFFVLFTRESCAFCHQMGDTLTTLSNDTGLPLHNASLETKCMPYVKADCIVGPQALAAAQALSVTTVPSLFLFVPKNTWLRIGTGVVDVSTLKNRTSQFFTAYRNALLQGVNNSSSSTIPSVSFSASPDATGTAPGAPLSERAAEDQVRSLLKAPPPQ